MSEAEGLTVRFRVTPELLADCPPRSFYDDLIFHSLRQLSHPWEQPHRNPFPNINPTPRLSRVIDLATETRTRALGALDVLRYGVSALEGD